MHPTSSLSAALPSRRNDTLLRALDVIVRQLAHGPDNDEATALRVSALELRGAIAHGAHAGPASPEMRNALQKRVLSLHLATRRLAER